MIGETILAGTSARCKQAYNWRDNISLIIGLQSASWWSVNIYCANCWPTIGAPITVPPILAQSSAVSFNSANSTWVADWSKYQKLFFYQKVKSGRQVFKSPQNPFFLNSISDFDFQFQLSILIFNFDFRFRILISIFNVNPLLYDLSIWPRITGNWTLKTINHKPDPYYLPLARNTNHEPDERCCLYLVRSTYGSHPWCVFLMFGPNPEFLTTSLTRYCRQSG